MLVTAFSRQPPALLCPCIPEYELEEVLATFTQKSSDVNLYESVNKKRQQAVVTPQHNGH